VVQLRSHYWQQGPLREPEISNGNKAVPCRHRLSRDAVVRVAFVYKGATRFEDDTPLSDRTTISNLSVALSMAYPLTAPIGSQSLDCGEGAFPPFHVTSRHAPDVLISVLMQLRTGDFIALYAAQ
jgi:hypothetical protein